MAELGGGGRRTHRANESRTALNAAVGDVFQIVGCGAVAETRRFDGHKYHPVTALCAAEHQARQAGRQNVLAVVGWLGPSKVLPEIQISRIVATMKTGTT